MRSKQDNKDIGNIAEEKDVNTEENIVSRERESEIVDAPETEIVENLNTKEEAFNNET